MNAAYSSSTPLKKAVSTRNVFGGGGLRFGLPAVVALVIILTLGAIWFAPIYHNTRIVLLTTGLLGVAAGLIGGLAVLRRRALVGDALAHAALPGLCLAFIVAGSRGLPILLAGAFASGILGTICITLLRRGTRIKEDAAIGIVLSVFFGAGMALSRVIQNSVTAASRAGLDRYILGQAAGIVREDLNWIAGLSLAIVFTVLLLFKEFKLVGFDQEFAGAQGWPVTRLDLLLLGLIAVTVIIGLPAVGVVMIAALLILPAASARFWTDRLDHMLAISAAMGAAIGLSGTLLSANLSRMPTGPLIVLSGTGLFAISALFASRRGLVIQWWKRRAYRQNALNQHILAVLARVPHDRAQPLKMSIDALAGHAAMPIGAIRRWAKLAARNGWIQVETAGALVVTDSGHAAALEIAQAQRAWIRFAEDRPDAAAKIAELDILMAVNRIREGEDSPTA